MNVLIPIMANGFDKSIVRRNYLDSKEKIGMILDIAVIAEFFRANTDGEKKILIYSESSVQREWNGNLDRIEFAIKKMEQRMQDRIEARNVEILESIQDFEKSMLTTREEINRVNENLTEMREFIKNGKS